MKFSDVQLEAIEARNANILVSASAGSGKTSVLVERLCQLVLKDHISIDSILAMTFTEDAASEMKIRLMSRLQKEPQGDYIQNQLALLETARICTIDSFCLSLVQTYYYQLGISYTMSKRVASQAQSNQAFQKAYQKAWHELDSNHTVCLKEYFTGFSKTEADIQSYIRSFIEMSLAKPNDKEWIQSLMNSSSQDKFIDPWFYQFFIEHIQSLIEICDEMSLIDESFLTKKEQLNSCLAFLQNKDYSSFKQAFKVYFLNTPVFKKTYSKEDFSSIQKEFKEHESKITDVLFDEEIFMSDTHNIQDIKTAFLKLSLLVKENFAQEKKNMEIIDFSDMEHFAYELLQVPMIQEEIRNQYEMILVDEFQDTNDLQESIIQSFARKDNVFRVGDIKQSIYGFRQAKPDIMKSHMNKQDEYHRLLVLDENYRSNESIITFNNDFYQKIMNTELLGSQFDHTDIAQVGTDTQRNNTQYPVRFLFTEYTPWIEAQDEKISVLTAKRLHRENQMDLIAQDMLEKHALGIPFKDMCILTRTHKPQESLKKVLETYDIPCLAEIDHGFYSNQAIQVIVSCLMAYLDPYDDIALTSCLLSKIGQVSSSQLATSCIQKERGRSLYEHIKNEPWMDSWHSISSQSFESISDLIRTLYAHNDFYFSHTSKQDKTNLDLFLELASNFEEPENIALFVSQIKDASQLDTIGEAYPYGKEADVVKMKTMHHSKGLQFPIVYIWSQHETKDKYSSLPVLMDPTLGISFMSLIHQKIKRMSKSHIAFLTKKQHDDLQEEMRVFYVATTRAEKELIIVDSISSRMDYEKPLSTRILLQRRSYTSWLLHTYSNDPNSKLVFDKKLALYDRPKQNRKDSITHQSLKYSKPTLKVESQTASQKKLKWEWKPFELSQFSGSDRGTLFHEIVAQCPYPYQSNDIEQFAKQKDYVLSQTDVSQILSLNDNHEYASMMEHKHAFELSYIVKNEDVITHGFMDLVVWFEDHIEIIDFKTDHVNEANELISLYQEQLSTYKEALMKIEKNKPILTKIYSFCLKDMISL